MRKSHDQSHWLLCTAVLTVLVLTFPSIVSARPRWVTAEGVGSIIGGDIGRARDEALRDARRRAVEEAVGAFVESETVMENMEVIADTIFSKAEGYVTDEHIQSEWQEDGLYWVRIEALVDSLSLENDLAFLIHRANNPQVLIAIDETNIDHPSPFSLLESQMRQLFVKKGFHVIDLEQAERNQLRQLAKGALLATDFSSAVTIAHKHHADVLILGTVYTQLKSQTYLKGGMSAYVVEALADIRAVNAQTSQVVASTSASDQAYAASAQAAGSKALAQMAAEVVESLNNGVLRSEPTARTIQVTVNGVESFSQERRIQEDLSLVRGVEGVYRRLWENQVAQYDVKTTLSVDDIAFRLEQSAHVPLRITGINLNEIMVRVAD